MAVLLDTNEFPFGQNNFLGRDLIWNLDRVNNGILVTAGIGVGKSQRFLLPLTEQLLKLRATQSQDEKWAALIIDPKITLISKIRYLVEKMGQALDLLILSETEQFQINLLRSGLSGKKLAEIIAKSLFAGATMSQNAGAAYYESRAISLLGLLIALAQLSNKPCLRTVCDMVDILSTGGTLDSPKAEAADALRRIEIFQEDDSTEKRKVLSSIQNYLEPFRSMPWKAIFFEDGPFSLDMIRDTGKIVLTSFSPTEVNNLQTGLFLIKELWFTVIMQRLSPNFSGNARRKCLYVCDEFQKIAGPSSEANFFDVRREAGGCPIVAFQQLSQLRTILPTEWLTVVGMLSTKVFMRNPDVETAKYVEELCGLHDVQAHSFHQQKDEFGFAYRENSRTESKQTRPRLPADYIHSLPDGDAIIVSDERQIAWYPRYGLTAEQEIQWRKKRWPHRMRLVHPTQYRA